MWTGDKVTSCNIQAILKTLKMDEEAFEKSGNDGRVERRGDEKMPNIKVQPSGNIYEYEVGKTLLEVLLEEGIFVDNPCNGKGTLWEV